ncbi:MAG TPA: hypothetical protein VGN93_06265 [Shinella sp.]|uniref:hypothetical protein n=1 Tax=Shinella sp. TaxID=1870904 RepID=UPI002E12A960|nr:hypothetical protein [Shinella sp.]
MPQPDLFPASFLAAMITFVVVLVGYRITKHDQKLGRNESFAALCFVFALSGFLLATNYLSDWIFTHHPSLSTVLHILYGNLLACGLVATVQGLRTRRISQPFERLFFTGLLFAFPIGAVWMLA